MTTFPGSHMTAFPSLWSVIDEPTGRIICELDNPMRRPRRRHDHQRDEHLDHHLRGRRPVVPAGRHLQPAALSAGGHQVVPQGRRRSARSTMSRCCAGMRARTEAPSEHTQAGHRRQRFPGLACHPPARRRRRTRCARWCAPAPTPAASTTWTSPGLVHGDVFDTAIAARGDGRLRRRLLLRRRHPRLAA